MSIINENEYPIISGLSYIFNKYNSIIDPIRKFSTFTLSILSLISLTDLYITGNTYSLNVIYNSIGVYLIIDILFTKNEFILHHIFINQLFLLNFYYNIDISKILPFIKFLTMTEISSIFLSIKHLFRIFNIHFVKYKYFNKIKLVNDILFFISFLITRIINYYLFILNNNIQNIIITYYENSYIANYIVYTSLYGLYGLNLYWFGLILHQISNVISKRK